MDVDDTSRLPSYKRNSLSFRSLSIALVTVFGMSAAEFSYAQSVPAAEAKLEFDVASVKQNKSDDESSANFPLGPGDVYGSVGGHFAATNFPLVVYIRFAYRVVNNQMASLDSQLPSWAKTDRFDIEARAPGNPTKDQMRLMMRALLADRFQLKIHTESHEATVLALQLLKPGLTGPQLQPHPENSKCSNKAEEDTSTSSDFEGKHIGVGNFPSGLVCGGVLGLPPSEPNLFRLGARDVTVGLIAAGMTSWGDLGKAVIDKTGLSGMYDFSLEWLPDRLGSDSATQVENAGPGFLQAVKEQLGLKLTTQKGAIQVIVLDHLEHPSAN